MTTFKIRGKFNFPPTVTATGGLGIRKANGTWTVEPTWEDLDLITTVSTPETKELWVKDPVTDIYYRMGVSALIAALPTGPAGATGATGDKAGFKYTFNSATSGDPGSGKFLFNNATFASATAANISETDGDSIALATYLATLDDGTSTTKCTLVWFNATGSKGFIADVTGTLTDSGAYDTFSITPNTSWGSPANGDVFRMQAFRVGNKGTDGAGTGDVVGPAASVDGEVALFNSTTGKLIKRASISGIAKLTSGVLSAAAAGTDYQAADAQLFSNIPQNSKSAAYTTVLTDGQKHIFHPSADTTARIWTIDSNANVAYPIGTAITFVNQHSGGVITISITSDTMRLAGLGTTGSRTLAADGIATALKIATTEWIISGTGLT